MKKLLLALILFFAFATPIVAATYSREDIDVDTTLSEQEATQYAQPTKILITQVKTDAASLNNSPLDWFQTLYYYSITRLGYADIPFNYIIDRNGDIYEGRDGGIGVLPEVETDSGVVLIGYLSNSPDLPLNTQTALQDLVEDLSYKHGIGKDAVQVVTLKHLKADDTRRTAKSSYEEVTGTFSDNVASLTGGLKYSSSEHLEYKGEIKDLQFSESVESGERFKVSFTLVNKNDFAWFTDKDYIYVSTKNGRNSSFAINGEWDSFSKPVSIADKTILPEENVKIEFEMQALLLPGKQSPEFTILKLPRNSFAGTDFKVSFDIKKGNNKLVQISGTPGGVLNVRGCPSPNCEPITQVNEGQILIMTDQSVGWYEVKYEDDKTGWVYGPYVKEL
jgi:hypothetical protein